MSAKQSRAWDTGTIEVAADDPFGTSSRDYADFRVEGMESLGDNVFRLNGVKMVDFSGPLGRAREGLTEVLGEEETEAALEHFHRWLETRQLAQAFASRARRVG